MSSTTGKVNKDDYYATPEWIVREFFEAFDTHIDKDWWMSANVLDPSCGGCAEHKAIYPEVISDMYDVESIVKMDIREDSHAYIVGNYLEHTFDGVKFDMVVTNPPFSLSVPFAEKAISEVTEGGYVILLQRLNWLGSKKRKPFWDSMPLKAVIVHHKRPSFHGTSGTDSIEYAHFVFKKGYTGTPKLYVI